MAGELLFWTWLGLDWIEITASLFVPYYFMSMGPYCLSLATWLTPDTASFTPLFPFFFFPLLILSCMLFLLLILMEPSDLSATTWLRGARLLPLWVKIPA